MITSLVNLEPKGDFAEVSVLQHDWQKHMAMLVAKNCSIKYDMYPLLGIPQDTKNILEQHGYKDLVLKQDQWQHFLVPNQSDKTTPLNVLPPPASIP